jgi:hypothetical protein
MSCISASYLGTLSWFTDRRLFYTPAKVKPFESPGKAGGLLILINHGAMSYEVLLDVHKFEVRYYNISNEYILQLFNINFIKCLSEAVTLGTIGGYDHFFRIINFMDKDELAKFRNLLFTLHNYKFKQNKWINFFKEYYNNYSGTLNEEDAFSEFTEREKIILGRILQKEKE